MQKGTLSFNKFSAGTDAIREAREAIKSLQCLGAEIESVVASGTWRLGSLVTLKAHDIGESIMAPRVQTIPFGGCRLRPTDESRIDVVGLFDAPADPDPDLQYEFQMRIEHEHGFSIALDDGPVACECEFVDGPGEGSVEDPGDVPANPPGVGPDDMSEITEEGEDGFEEAEAEEMTDHLTVSTPDPTVEPPEPVNVKGMP
jgi:hypothetical protein